MPYHIMSIPCLRVLQDKANNLTSIIDIVDTAPVGTSENLSIPPFKLFSKWGKNLPENEADSFEVKLSLSGPQSRKKQLDRFKVEIPANVFGITIMLDVGSIKVKKAGLWFLHIAYRTSQKGKWRETAMLPFHLKQEEQKNTGQSA